MKEIILINITGKDKPGLTAHLTLILAAYKVTILDIGQAVIHDYLSLGMLIEIPEAHKSSAVLKELLFAAHKIGISVQFTPIEESRYEAWALHRGKERRFITLLGRQLTADQIAKVAAVIADNNLNIDIINRLSGRIPVSELESPPKACIRLTVSGHLDDPGPLRGALLAISEETGIDISFHVDNIYSQNRRLVVFDMDSTLIQEEVIVELAKAAGASDQVARMTEAAMDGEYDFAESLKRRVGLLKGLPADTLGRIAASLTLSEGAETVIETLKALGYKIGIISGGFDYFGRYLQEKLGLDYVFANSLEIRDGKLTGRITGDIIDARRKAEILKTITTVENINLQQTIAVGDGANDLNMLRVAGLGVAFHAKPVIRQNAHRSISSVGLDGLLYLLGISEREIRQS